MSEPPFYSWRETATVFFFLGTLFGMIVAFGSCSGPTETTNRHHITTIEEGRG